jgi:putative membrane protein
MSFELFTDVPENWDQLCRAWPQDLLTLALLAITGWMYFAGILRLWRATHFGAGVSAARAACFLAGWVTLFIAVASPLHPWGEALFYIHMIQHELLMIVAAPLIVLGQPLIVMLWAFPRSWRPAIARPFRSPVWSGPWAVISSPLPAWIIHSAILWIWHMPPLFNAAVQNLTFHALQHLSFFGSGLLFWWAVFEGHLRKQGYGIGVLYMFTTAIHTGVLGALLAFSNSPWYLSYIETAPAWGYSALEDQQIGGLIMWVPAGLVYIAAGLVLFAFWLKESDRRAVTWQQQADSGRVAL